MGLTIHDETFELGCSRDSFWSIGFGLVFKQHSFTYTSCFSDTVVQLLRHKHAAVSLYKHHASRRAFRAGRGWMSMEVYITV